MLSGKTILLSINGTIGNRAFYNAEPVLLGKSAAFLNINSECSVPYIYYVLGSKRTLDQFNDGLTGSTIKNLGLGTIRNTLIPMPILAEQEKIATALSDTDALISELEKLIEKKQAIKNATMQQLLTGKTRLPEFTLREDGTPKAYKDSELGQIPEDWTIKKLSDLATVKTGGTPSTVNNLYWNGGYLWCTPTDITALKGSKYLTGTSRTLSKLGIENSSAEVLPIDTIVMSSRATIGECAILKKQASTNQGFKNFICFEDTSNEYIYYLLTTLKQDFIGLCSGSTFLEISTTQVRNFKVKIPRFDEQLAISEVLSNIDTEIAQLNFKLAKVKNIKLGMIQELLTGKTRLV
ncbi:restriction endonuclease subunit S [Acinetobacter higginsii]|uniref:restriction endonuclease subunit S n=1 Tax=Acinetobacter higginsii TaxID=70347 RepID=UPI0030B9B542